MSDPGGNPVQSEFLTELDTRDIDDDHCVLLSDLVYMSAIYGGKITVPTGFVTDLASVPRVPVIYMAFGDRAHREAVVHDYLYQTHLVKKSVADRIFLEAMKARGKPLWVRWGMYLGVVLGGASSYKSGPKRYLLLQEKTTNGGKIC